MIIKVSDNNFRIFAPKETFSSLLNLSGCASLLMKHCLFKPKPLHVDSYNCK